MMRVQYTTVIKSKVLSNQNRPYQRDDLRSGHFLIHVTNRRFEEEIDIATELTVQVDGTVPEIESQTEQAEISDGGGIGSCGQKIRMHASSTDFLGKGPFALMHGRRLEIRIPLNSPFHGVPILICEFYGTTCDFRAHIQLLFALSYLSSTR